MNPFSPANEDDQSLTSKSLLEEAKSGDPDGWEELVQQYGLRIYRMCKKAGIPNQDAADITQDVFTAISRSISRFRHAEPGDSFRHWLSTITTNKIRDYFRRGGPTGQGGSTWQERICEVPDDLSEPDAESSLSAANRRRMDVVEQVRAWVSERDWQVFERLVIDEWPADKVAEEFGISRSLVYTVKSRTLRHFRNVTGRDF